MKISGVYKITNTITGDFYVGSSKNIKKRWSNHKSPYNWKLHPNVKLYKAMASYGLDNFTFEVLEETTDLHNREQYWIDKLKPVYNSMYAKGCDAKRRKETSKRCKKEWHKAHRDEQLVKMKAYSKAYNNRLCFYEGETLTLHALTNRFFRQGMPHPTLDAKEYLL